MHEAMENSNAVRTKSVAVILFLSKKLDIWRILINARVPLLRVEKRDFVFVWNKFFIIFLLVRLLLQVLQTPRSCRGDPS